MICLQTRWTSAATQLLSRRSTRGFSRILWVRVLELYPCTSFRCKIKRQDSRNNLPLSVRVPSSSGTPPAPSQMFWNVSRLACKPSGRPHEAHMTAQGPLWGLLWGRFGPRLAPCRAPWGLQKGCSKPPSEKNRKSGVFHWTCNEK